MPFIISPFPGGFGAEVSGIDLRTTIDQVVVDSFENALAEFGVLVLRNQQINDDQQQAFIEKFGPPTEVKVKELQTERTKHTHFFDVSTVDDDGARLDPASARGMYMLANLLWHTDGSQAQPPVRLTALHARQLPPKPPTTEYANMRAAYDALDAEMKERIENMQVEHSIVYSRSKVGMQLNDWSEETLRRNVTVVHPLVRRHPRTGRKSLYLASHASHVIGKPVEEGRALIESLTEFATQRKFVHAHEWQPHDLVFWDDSWTMHRAMPYEGDAPRVLRWSGVRELEAV